MLVYCVVQTLDLLLLYVSSQKRLTIGSAWKKVVFCVHDSSYTVERERERDDCSCNV
jgi:hypothetical protein